MSFNGYCGMAILWGILTIIAGGVNGESLIVTAIWLVGGHIAKEIRNSRGSQ